MRKYDFAGRLKVNDVGTTGTPHPFKQTLGYDAFNNITSRSTLTHSFVPKGFQATYANHRKTSGGYGGGTDTFDAAGNVVQNFISPSNNRTWQFDAGGRVSRWIETGPYESLLIDAGADHYYDGDGRVAKKVERGRNRANGNTTWTETPEYSIFSSVTGQKITSLNSTGGKATTFVYMGATVIAEQHLGGGSVYFKNNDPISGSIRQTDPSGEMSGENFGRVDMAGFGTSIPSAVSDLDFPIPNYSSGGYTGNPEDGCEANGTPMPCSALNLILKPGDTVYVNTRSAAGWDFYRRLKRNIRRHDVFADDVGNDTSPNGENGPIRVDGATRYLYSWYEVAISISGTNADNPTPCANMARRSQRIANEVMSWARKEKKSAAEALNMFDRSFTPHYIGQTLHQCNFVL